MKPLDGIKIIDFSTLLPGPLATLMLKDEIRLRVINSKILNPESIMPSYFVKIEYERTPAKLLRKTILSFKEVEDIVEYLYSLK